MRRLLLSAVAAVSLALSTLASDASAASLTISPPAGGENDTFAVRGAGLQPGLALDINFISPDGEVYSTAVKNKVVVIGPDGSFELSVVPAKDFKGESPGTWHVQVCVTQTDDCAETDFDIAV